MDRSILFSPFTLGNLHLKNRLIRAGCFEGMSQGGMVTDNLIEHHRRLAQGGIAMTTVAYCSVSYDGRVFDHELWMREEILPQLQKLTKAVHNEGAKVSIQLGHAGFFTSQKIIGQQPMGASPKFCLFTKSYCREMTPEDIDEKVNEFTTACLLVKEAGFDAAEIHAGHGYLLSQFLSPWTNKRKDKYGGSLENRLRFPCEVIKRARRALGAEFPILVKMNQLDGMKGGVDLEEAIIIAKAFESAGATALIPSAGFTSKVPFLMLRGDLPIKEMVQNRDSWLDKVGLQLFGQLMVPRHNYESLFLLKGAARINHAVKIPVIYIGGVDSRDGLEQVLNQGFNLVQLGRATIQNPDFPNQLINGDLTKSACDHCNRCVAAMDADGVKCVSNELGFQYP